MLVWFYPATACVGRRLIILAGRLHDMSRFSPSTPMAAVLPTFLHGEVARRLSHLATYLATPYMGRCLDCSNFLEVLGLLARCSPSTPMVLVLPRYTNSAAYMNLG